MLGVKNMKTILWIASSIAAIAATSVLAQPPIDPAPPQVDVALVIGKNSIPISVHQSFRESAAMKLPKPGGLPLADPHDRKHNEHKYCYSFDGKVVELFDSDFGLHTIRESPAKPLHKDLCPPLPMKPIIVVGGKTIEIGMAPFDFDKSLFPGFNRLVNRQTIILKKEWKYKDPTRPHMWGTCFFRSVSIEAEFQNANISSITIQN